MTTTGVQHYLNLADESHEVAKAMLSLGHPRFSAAQTYYTFFYLTQALLLTKGLTYSSHSAVVAAYGREFSRTRTLDPKFHRYIIDAQELRQTGHYGEEGDEVTKEEASKSLEWAAEFMHAVRDYLGA